MKHPSEVKCPILDFCVRTIACASQLKAKLSSPNLSTSMQIMRIRMTKFVRLVVAGTLVAAPVIAEANVSDWLIYINDESRSFTSIIRVALGLE